MLKNNKNKIKKIFTEKDRDEKDDVKKTGEDEETEKESGGTLSDGVLDAFDEVTPVDPLLVAGDEIVLPEDEDNDEIDSGDYRSNDEW